MELSNTERVHKALELLRDGLGPVCESTWQRFYGDRWLQQVKSKLHNPKSNGSTEDVAFLLKAIKVTWNEIFSHEFDPSVRSLVFELSKARNAWAHQVDFSDDDAWRALDSMERVLKEFSVGTQRDQIRTLRRNLMRKMKLESINSNSVTKPNPLPKVRYPLEETSEICGALPKQIERWINEPTFLIPQSEIEQTSYLRFDFLNLVEIKVIQQLLSFGFLVEQLIDMPSTDTIGWENHDNFLFVSSDGRFHGDGVWEPSEIDPEKWLDRDDNTAKIAAPARPKKKKLNPKIDPQNVHNYIDLESDVWYMVINMYKIRKDLLANLIELAMPYPRYLDVDQPS